MAITTQGVTETVATLRDICEKKRACTDKDLVAVNNGIYDYGNKILMDFDPTFVFTSKSHVDFVDHAPNPVIHNGEDGTDWDVVSWMDELSDDPEIVKLLWQIIGAVIRHDQFKITAALPQQRRQRPPQLALVGAILDQEDG